MFAVLLLSQQTVAEKGEEAVAPDGAAGHVLDGVPQVPLRGTADKVRSHLTCDPLDVICPSANRLQSKHVRLRVGAGRHIRRRVAKLQIFQRVFRIHKRKRMVPVADKFRHELANSVSVAAAQDAFDEERNNVAGAGNGAWEVGQQWM